MLHCDLRTYSLPRITWSHFTSFQVTIALSLFHHLLIHTLITLRVVWIMWQWAKPLWKWALMRRVGSRHSLRQWWGQHWCISAYPIDQYTVCFCIWFRLQSFKASSPVAHCSLQSLAFFMYWTVESHLNSNGSWHVRLRSPSPWSLEWLQCAMG